MSNFYLSKPIKIPLGQPVEGSEITSRLCKLLGVTPSRVRSLTLHKQSVDARNKQDVCFVCSYLVETDQKVLKNATPYKPSQDLLSGETPNVHGSCIVVGAGPAGLFLARYLSRCGMRVTVIEKGSDVTTRKQKVQAFFDGGPLDENCNVQFGLGGAGTFSDGKLTTGISSPLTHTVFHEFVRMGSPRQILTSAMPHIGTDNLVTVVDAMRSAIIADGGKFLFDTTVTDLIVEDGQAVGVIAQSNGSSATEKIYADCVALCLGNSARETFRALHVRGVDMESKPFAVGLRVEHPRKFIDTAQYGQLFATHRDLGAATYKLVNNVNGRACYSFCMCPGGVVVPATSAYGAVVVNGMSNYARDGENSNSALVVSVNADDLARYGFTHPIFAGIDFQEHLEKSAYKLGGGNFRAPSQSVVDFATDNARKLGAVAHTFETQPSYSRGVADANLRELFPQDISEVLAQSINYFDSKIKGFGKCGVLTGVETRTSSPIKILRDKDSLESNVQCLYPVGEGAGHAGGIVSSAVDGLRVALVISRKFSK